MKDRTPSAEGKCGESQRIREYGRIAVVISQRINAMPIGRLLKSCHTNRATTGAIPLEK